jgi:uncharacterized membrane-anchored protein
MLGAPAMEPSMNRVLPADHPQRYAMTNELHARPFPVLQAPCQAVHLAFKGGPEIDPARQLGHLTALVDRFGAERPARDAAHYLGDVGRIRVKWERHTEFVTYTLFADEDGAAPFAQPIEHMAPADWLAAAPGDLISAIRVHVEPVAGEAEAEAALTQRLHRHFVAESLAGSHVAADEATVFGDFRIQEDGFVRFAVLAGSKIGPRRLGRVVQQVMEIETYRVLSMLALPVARRLAGDLTRIETELTAIIDSIAAEGRDDRETLARLTALSAEIEAQEAQTAYRFAAARAYAALVQQRIKVMGERRAANRQTLGEFMARRYSPAMRTCEAQETRLRSLAARAARAATLLSVRVNVAVEAQNQELLSSMNRRAELQLRLQRTVEGLSVVAISYYAVSLASYLLKPVAKGLDMAPETLMALVTLPVVYGVWRFIRRIRETLEKEH